MAGSGFEKLTTIVWNVVHLFPSVFLLSVLLLSFARTVCLNQLSVFGKYMYVFSYTWLGNISIELSKTRVLRFVSSLD